MPIGIHGSSIKSRTTALHYLCAAISNFSPPLTAQGLAPRNPQCIPSPDPFPTPRLSHRTSNYRPSVHPAYSLTLGLLPTAHFLSLSLHTNRLWHRPPYLLCIHHITRASQKRAPESCDINTRLYTQAQDFHPWLQAHRPRSYTPAF